MSEEAMIVIVEKVSKRETIVYVHNCNCLSKCSTISMRFGWAMEPQCGNPHYRCVECVAYPSGAPSCLCFVVTRALVVTCLHTRLPVTGKGESEQIHCDRAVAVNNSTVSRAQRNYSTPQALLYFS